MERLSHSPKVPERTRAGVLHTRSHTRIVLKMELLATSLWQTHTSAFGDFGQLTHDAGKEFKMISFYGKIFEF